MPDLDLPNGLPQSRRWVNRIGFLFLFGYVLASTSIGANAAPGKLAQGPLFLTSGVQPNIFLLLDDSGSMDWEVLKSDGARVAHSNESYYPDRDNVDFTPNNTTERLELCAGYNVLAYNPDVIYTPWFGKDRYGNAFQDQDPTRAWVNPYTGGNSSYSCSDGGFITNSNGRRCNLISGFNNGDGVYYYVWNDADGDGVYASGECPTDGSNRSDPGSRVYVRDLSNAEQINYANWFSYYRKREYVMKRAISEIITESRERMGLATINQKNHVTQNTEVGTQIKDIDDVSLPLDTNAQSNKALLLDNLLGINSSSTTPLRIALKRTGEYFKGTLSSNNLFGFAPVNDPDSSNGHSPILKKDLGGECQQNFAVVMSDGFWNGSTNPSVGNTDGPAPDGDVSSPYDGLAYADDYSNTLADVAMEYYENDLIVGLDNKVPKVNILAGKDENVSQHLVTFTVAFGISGDTSCDPQSRDIAVESQGWPEVCADPSHTGSGNGWPEPEANETTTVDDMRHAAWNGRGRFLSAKDPQELITQLNAAIKDISSRTATASAAVAVTSTSIQVGGMVYQASFDSNRWAGELTSYNLTDSGLGASVWHAHDLLENRDLGTDPRVMITFDGSYGIPFRFPADYQNPQAGELTEQQIKDLLFYAPNIKGPPWNFDTISSSEISDNQSYGEDLMDYFRGQRAHEGDQASNFRQRSGLLGDIIHSAPVFVGDPDPMAYPDSIEPLYSYQTWANVDAHGRTPMIYVGSNDGALHAFEADTGREVFAYFPKLIFSDSASDGLHPLAQQNYKHRYYVDQTPTITEVNIDTGDGNGQQWRSVLVGALRGGGKGLFALDVSDPSMFTNETSAASQVLWEFSDANLGYTFSKPTLAKLNNGEWAAIFGNGYNTDPSGDGSAKLYIVYLDGSNINNPVILETGSGSMVSNDCENPASDCNGLSTPALIDLGGDGVADRIYVGDLKGNLWVFDISSSQHQNWGSAYINGSTPIPMFIADNGSPQPITTQPAVTTHLTQKDVSTEPNTMVFVGTGQFITASDSLNTGVQSFYALWDKGSPIAGRHALQQQTLTTTTHTVGTSTYDIRTLSDNNVDYTTQDGWYVDFSSEAGERVIASPLLFGELIVYTTITPNSTQCQGAGTSWLMVHDFYDGSEPNYTALDVDNDGSWDGNDIGNGHNIAGLKSSDLLWDPTIVQSGIGTEGTLLLPKDSTTSGDSLETRKIKGASNQPLRSSWTRIPL